jgi:hypothetical protein
MSLEMSLQNLDIFKMFLHYDTLQDVLKIPLQSLWHFVFKTCFKV